MAKIDFENLLNPVGSVHHAQWGYNGLQEREFDHSADNPAMKLIESMLSSGRYKDEDVADLYDQAAQWEIDRANWLDQLQVDQAIKEEQREYDSPLQQVARARDAGINLDLQGSGSAGAGATAGTSAGATSPDHSLIGNTDNYAGKYFTLSALQTAGQLFSTFVDSASTIVGAHSQLSLLDANRNLLGSQAGLMDAQANDMEQTLPYRLDSLGLANSNSYLSQLSDMAVLMPNATDEQLTASLSSAGYTDEQIPGAIDVIKGFRANPELQARYNNNQVAARFAAARNQEYNTEYVARMVSYANEIEENGAISELYQSRMNASLKMLLSGSSYVEDTANTMIGQADLSEQTTQQHLKEYKIHCKNFWDRIQMSADKCKEIDAKITELKEQGERFKVNHRGKYPPSIQAAIDSLTDQKFLIYQSATADMNTFYNSLNDYSLKKYISSEMIDYDGSLRTLNGRQKVEQFGRVMFHDLVVGAESGGAIASRALNFVSTLALPFLGAAGAAMAVGKAATTVTNTVTQTRPNIWTPQNTNPGMTTTTTTNTSKYYNPQD